MIRIQSLIPAMAAVLALFGGARSLHAQIADAPPRYWLAAGGGYNGAASGVKFGGLLSIGVRLNATTWSYTTQETAALGSSMRTGLATTLYSSSGGGVILLGLADAGMAVAGTGALGGAFSGGGVAAFKLDKLLKQTGLYFGVDVRIQKLNAGTAESKPTISFVLAKAF